MYSETIMRTLRQRFDLEPDDTSKDVFINSQTPFEVLGSLLEWEGIIGYKYIIAGWVRELYGFDLETGI